MVSEDAEDMAFKRHSDLCSKLNVDLKTITESWNNYKSISEKYTLEGDLLHWLGCSIFVACKKSTTPTLENQVLEGNCVNLTSLLRHCNLTLVQFFCNIRKFADMLKLSDEFRHKIDVCEGRFSVICNIFNEYCTIFNKLFKAPDLENTKQHRNRKQNFNYRPTPCTSYKVFEFCWNLYIILRGEDVYYLNDLVQSYHLLLAVCDLAFENAFLSERKDLINPQFEGLPSNWLSEHFTLPKTAPCIIDFISNSKQTVEAKHMKKYHIPNILSRFKNNLVSNPDCTGLFDSQNFEQNVKNLTKLYETRLLNYGEFDERIFLAEFRRRVLLSYSNEPTESPVGSHQYGTVGNKVFETPLSCRRFLEPRESFDRNALYAATQSISKLLFMLRECKPTSSSALLQIFSNCSRDPTETIEEIVKTLGDKFLSGYLPENCQDDKEIDKAQKRLECATTLFYKLILTIFKHEKNITKDISVLVEKKLFYESVFTCSLEIVLHAYGSKKKFPWILNTLQMEGCHFYKVIELIVRSKEPFYRDTIKHLSKIEEMILDQIAWKSGSYLWTQIEHSDIPKLEDIALPWVLNAERTPQNGASDDAPPAIDRFESPVNTTNTISRKLFPHASAGQSVLQKHLIVTDKDGNKRLIPLVDVEQSQQEKAAPPMSPSQGSGNRPKRTGSLAIFFRKFYNLASLRLQHLCDKMSIPDVETRRRMWTIFEESVRNHTSLLKDRHLDQLLMCAVYVSCKVRGEPREFTTIMHAYRSQPQADSAIYRSVLLTSTNRDDDEMGLPEQRGDLIAFYNQVYMEKLRTFALRFIEGSNDIFLSPLPATRRMIVSPSVKVYKNIYVKPLESPTMQPILGKTYNYTFSRSPSKDLKDINRAINCGVNGKRLLSDADIPPSKKITTRKVQSLLEERRSQLENESSN